MILLIGGLSAGLHDIKPGKRERYIDMYLPREMPSAEEIEARMHETGPVPIPPRERYERREFFFYRDWYTVWVFGSQSDSEIASAIRYRLLEPAYTGLMHGCVQWIGFNPPSPSVPPTSKPAPAD